MRKFQGKFFEIAKLKKSNLPNSEKICQICKFEFYQFRENFTIILKKCSNYLYLTNFFLQFFKILPYATFLLNFLFRFFFSFFYETC